MAINSGVVPLSVIDHHSIVAFNQVVGNGAYYLGFAMANLSWSGTVSYPFHKYSCDTDGTICNTRFDTDYSGNVTVRVDWEADAYFFDPFGGRFDAYFKWYIDNVLTKIYE